MSASWTSSASKTSVTVTQPHDPSSSNMTSTIRPAGTKSVSLSYDHIIYEKLCIASTAVYCPTRSNQKLPSRASIRVVNVSPTVGSDHLAHGQCRVAASANARWVMCSGFRIQFRTCDSGAYILTETVSFMIQ